MSIPTNVKTRDNVTACARQDCVPLPPFASDKGMNPVLVQLVNDTIGLLDAVRHGDVKHAWGFADRVRTIGWAQGMPALASAAGAFQQSVEKGARSEKEMALAVQAIAYEMQGVVREWAE
ncbi:hypothetical protein BJI69_13625 [Luteibacter rhizovicinus DSM 16549]|uniref:Uncharacterized protein n=1 Tax=Luteibacter rhizovicinus DSM 16549 TaxID=1440763 RepID=A0A0G9HD26_9GAMM|nr:hypothetical protein [Luteibacter rhizovicinus]APG04829.1 hypothetical protein BJI69_13625 [Luteibacter rhizovicinus DSM 16549]KLD67416.1 hypothetical protein Y883_07930 [Luteibacter rhizovicinus DSM 16549]